METKISKLKKKGDLLLVVISTDKTLVIYFQLLILSTVSSCTSWLRQKAMV